jgi:putative hydrolase of the HAD superfamily
VKRSGVELLVLDVHGVVLNAYWPDFLREIARRTGESTEEVVGRWHRSLRDDAWSGRIEEAELWRRLIPSTPASGDWRAALEAGYRRGAAAPHLRRWAALLPLWLLSNHRSEWLLPRLVRFDLNDCVDRVLVSDAIGAAKPDPAAFLPILEAVSDPRRILFIDDQRRNVEVAQEMGMSALHADPHGAWVSRVDHVLRSAPSRAFAPSTLDRLRAARARE